MRGRSRPSEGLDLWENARLFGLLNLAMADGYIASWEAKYHYKFWRPITAIRLGDTDGNPLTEAVLGLDATAADLSNTRSRLRARGARGVAAEVLKQFFGTDRIAFAACSTTVPAGGTCEDPAPVIRSYSSFSEAAVENALSRIYIGIHFRRAVQEGVAARPADRQVRRQEIPEARPVGFGRQTSRNTWAGPPWSPPA